LINDPLGRSAVFTELAPTDSRFPKPNLVALEASLRRFNRDLVNLVSLPVNVHDFLHREMNCPSGTGQNHPLNA
jgi:hypothetical protein